MSRLLFVSALLLFIVTTASAGVGDRSGYSFDGNGLPEYPNEGHMWASAWGSANTTTATTSPTTETYIADGNSITYYYSYDAYAFWNTGTFAGILWDGSNYLCSIAPTETYHPITCSGNGVHTSSSDRFYGASVYSNGGFGCDGSYCDRATAQVRITVTTNALYNVSGDTACLSSVSLYYNEHEIDTDTNLSLANHYEFVHLIEGEDYTLVFDNGAYYDFTCTGDEIFDYDACIYVYGYTCGVTDIKLYKDNGGWVLDDSASQGAGYDVYEMLIADGEDYKISFIDSGIGGTTVCHNQIFSCTGDHVLIDFDRCNWVYPPSSYAPPYIIYTWAGYDYNIVVFKDEHGNFIENSQLAIYDQTDNQYIQRWTDASEGYTLLGARYDTDHDVLLSIRTFDGIFTLETTCPANGTAPVGEEDITTTNWTVPIKYNLNVQPVDQYGVSLFDVFCGLLEYTPLDPGSFWGMDLSDQGYVAVTNCSGFAMCDIIAEKDGYVDYKVEALNWTSKSALVKDYRHNVVMEEE